MTDDPFFRELDELRAEGARLGADSAADRDRLSELLTPGATAVVTAGVDSAGGLDSLVIDAARAAALSPGQLVEQIDVAVLRAARAAPPPVDSDHDGAADGVADSEPASAQDAEGRIQVAAVAGRVISIDLDPEWVGATPLDALAPAILEVARRAVELSRAS